MDPDCRDGLTSAQKLEIKEYVDGYIRTGGLIGGLFAIALVGFAGFQGYNISTSVSDARSQVVVATNQVALATASAASAANSAVSAASSAGSALTSETTAADAATTASEASDEISRLKTLEETELVQAVVDLISNDPDLMQSFISGMSNSTMATIADRMASIEGAISRAAVTDGDGVSSGVCSNFTCYYNAALFFCSISIASVTIQYTSLLGCPSGAQELDHRAFLRSGQRIQ